MSLSVPSSTPALRPSLSRRPSARAPLRPGPAFAAFASLLRCWPVLLSVSTVHPVLRPSLPRPAATAVQTLFRVLQVRARPFAARELVDFRRDDRHGRPTLRQPRRGVDDRVAGRDAASRRAAAQCAARRSRRPAAVARRSRPSRDRPRAPAPSSCAAARVSVARQIHQVDVHRPGPPGPPSSAIR